MNIKYASFVFALPLALWAPFASSMLTWVNRIFHEHSPVSVSSDEVQTGVYNPFANDLKGKEKLIRDNLMVFYGQLQAFNLYKMAFEVSADSFCFRPIVAESKAFMAINDFCRFYKPSKPLIFDHFSNYDSELECNILYKGTISDSFELQDRKYGAIEFIDSKSGYPAQFLREKGDDAKLKDLIELDLRYTYNKTPLAVRQLREYIRGKNGITQLKVSTGVWLNGLETFLKSKDNRLEVITISDFHLLGETRHRKLKSIFLNENFKPKHLVFHSPYGKTTITALAATHKKLNSLEIFVQKKTFVTNFYELIAKSSITELHLTYYRGQDLTDEDWALNNEGIKKALTSETNQITELRLNYGIPISTVSEILMHPNNKLKYLNVQMLEFTEGILNQEYAKFIAALYGPHNKLKVLSFQANAIFEKIDFERMEEVAKEKNMVVLYVSGNSRRSNHAGLQSQ